MHRAPRPFSLLIGCVLGAAGAGEFEAADAELAWVDLRDRYRLFLAYPEAVVRWPELAALARDRAAKLDELVANLAELRARSPRKSIVVDDGPDCTLGAPKRS